MKRYEIERDLLLQTCDTIDRVKAYLADRLLDMKDKKHSYCLHLSTAEVCPLLIRVLLFRLGNVLVLLLVDRHRTRTDLQS